MLHNPRKAAYKLGSLAQADPTFSLRSFAKHLETIMEDSQLTESVYGVQLRVVERYSENQKLIELITVPEKAEPASPDIKQPKQSHNFMKAKQPNVRSSPGKPKGKVKRLQFLLSYTKSERHAFISMFRVEPRIRCTNSDAVLIL